MTFVGAFTQAAGAQSSAAPIACDPNASLNILAYREQNTLDPGKSVGPQSDATRYWIYDVLIRVTPEGGLAPGLATSWKFVSPTVMRVTLRRGVTFHDGLPFNAAAVKATYERNKSLPGVSPSFTQPMAVVKDVTVASEYEVDYELKAPTPQFAFALTASPGMVVSPAALKEPLDVNAVGAGPFKLVKFSPNAVADLVRNDQYWDKTALACHPKEVHLFDVQDTQALLNGALKGQYHVARIDPNQVPQAKAAGLVVKSVATAQIHSFWFDFKNPALRNPAVRKAMMYAIDREALAKGLGLGLALPATQIFPPGSYAYSPAPEHQPAAYRYDPEKARKLLADAGYPNGITLKVVIQPLTFDQTLLQAVQVQMAKAGITLEIQQITSYSQYLNHQGDTYFGMGGGRADPFDFLQAQTSANGIYNPDGYPPTQQLTDLVAQIAKTEPTDSTRPGLLQRASGAVTDDARVIPVMVLQFNWVLSPCVVNFNPPSFGALQPFGLGWKAGCK
jgi:peptide/nickel transport system substrate-binding protein